MSNNKMEQFFASNRNAFDDKTPSDRVWTRIERHLFGAKQANLWNSATVWRAAAAMLLGLSLLQFFGQRMHGPTKEELAAQQEFLDVESYYAGQISEKISLIRNDDYFVDDQFTQDFEKLDAMYAVLTEELKKRPSEKVKDALVLNMLVRIDLLNQQIKELDESKKKQPEAAKVQS